MTTFHLAQQAEPLVLISYVKPLLAFALLLAWGRAVTQFNKDAGYFYLKQHLFNGVQIACGVLGVLALLLIPIFFLGLFVCILFMVGGAAAYWVYRNGQAPEEERWKLSMEVFTNRVEARHHQQAQQAATIVLLNHDESPREVPSGRNPNAEAHELLQRLLDWAVERGAERMEVQLSAEKAKVVTTVDGVQFPQDVNQPKLVLKMVDYIKSSAGLDVEERRKRQRGELRFRSGADDRHLSEVITLGSSSGLTLTMNLDAHQAVNRKPADLGLLAAQVEQVKTLLTTPGRVVLIAGPHHNGVRSTLLSMISQHDPYMQSIMTLETEKRFELEGVDHNYLEPTVPAQAFNDKLGSLIRTDPAAISIGALPDASTARIVAQSAPDVRFYLPVRADSGFAALKVYAKAVGDAKLAAESLGGIISQRLVRKLCLTCRVPYKPDPAALKKMNLPADRVSQLYKSSGQIKVKDKLERCPACAGLGYRGRVGVFEVLVFDDLARSMIAANEGERLRSHLRKNGAVWLQEAALEKVVEGVTDIKEVTRVLAEK